MTILTEDPARAAIAPAPDATWETLVSEGLQYREDSDERFWKLGDLAARVQTEYGKGSMDAYAAAIGVPSKRLREYRRVAVEFSDSSEFRDICALLTWSHFQCAVKVARRISKETALAMLTEANDNNLKVEFFRAECIRAVKESGGKADTPRLKRLPGCRDLHCFIEFDAGCYSLAFDANPGIEPGEYFVTISRAIPQEDQP